MSIYKDYIWVKGDGEVIIQRQDMNTGELTELPLAVKDGKIYATEPEEKVEPAKDTNVHTYDLLYEEGGAGTT